MSMCLGLVTLSDENIKRLFDDPPLVWRVIAPDVPELYQEARGRRKKNFFKKLFGSGTKEKSEIDFEMSAKEGAATDLDKAWHGIHYLLTGTDGNGEHPSNFLLSGGREIGRIDVGYGPARALSAAEVREVQVVLDAISDAELRARFNPNDMLVKKIYPEIWSRKLEDDDTLGYLMEYVQVLREYLRKAVSAGVGLVLYFS